MGMCQILQTTKEIDPFSLFLFSLQSVSDGQNHISVKVLKETKDGFWIVINSIHRYYSMVK